jgi:hypothetical protein
VDVFQYKAKLKYIESLRFVKDIEKEVRQLIDKLKPLSIGCGYNTDSDFGSDIYIYKLTIKALRNFKQSTRKVLPSYIYNFIREVTSNLLLFLLADRDNWLAQLYSTHPTINYTLVMDIFEFNEVIQIPNGLHNFKRFNNLIADNPIHFDLGFGTYLDGFEVYSTSLKLSESALVRAIMIKKSDFPNETRTVWNKYVAYLKSQNKNTYTTPESVSKQILELEQYIAALYEFKEQL